MTRPDDHPRDDLAAYALGALEPADDAAVAEHVATCDRCAAEVDELSGPLAHLAVLDLDDLDPPVAVPDDLFERTLAAARAPAAPSAPAAGKPATTGARASGRRTRLLMAAAAVVLIGAVGGGGLYLAGHHDISTSTSTAQAGPVRMSVQTRAEAGGTALTVRVSGLPEHERCRLVAVAADGSRHEAGRWTATYDGQATVSEATDVARADLRSFVLYDAAGRTLTTVRV